MPSRGFAILLVWASLVSVARAENEVVPLTLPSRDEAWPAMRERVQRIAALCAKQLAGSHVVLAPPPALDLGELEAARALALQGAIDEAAVALDRALEPAAREPERIADASAVVTSNLRRAEIALARGEVAVARAILARLYRYDPTIGLSAGEASPPLVATLDDVKRELGTDPPLLPADLGARCASEDVLIVGRRKSPTAVELFRYDRCRLIASAVADGEADASVAGALSVVPSSSMKTTEVRVRARRQRIAGVIVASLGVGLAATGGYLALHAARLRDRIGRCSSAEPCSNADFQAWGDSADRSQLASAVLLPVGAAAIVTGVVLFVVGTRRERTPPAVTISTSSSGMTFAWSARF